MKTISEMSLQELETEYSENKSTPQKISEKEIRQYEISGEIIKRFYSQLK